MFWIHLNIMDFIFSPSKIFIQTLVPLILQVSFLVPHFLQKLK
jgi:hypothetical protein